MNSPTPDPIQRWEALLQKARSDLAPPVDTDALLLVVRSAAIPRSASWLGDFSTLFTIGHTLPVCLTCAAVFGSFSIWQFWDAWQTLPWIQMIVTTTGGAS